MPCAGTTAKGQQCRSSGPHDGYCHLHRQKQQQKMKAVPDQQQDNATPPPYTPLPSSLNAGATGEETARRMGISKSPLFLQKQIRAIIRMDPKVFHSPFWPWFREDPTRAILRQIYDQERRHQEQEEEEEEELTQAAAREDGDEKEERGQDNTNDSNGEEAAAASTPTTPTRLPPPPPPSPSPANSTTGSSTTTRLPTPEPLLFPSKLFARIKRQQATTMAGSVEPDDSLGRGDEGDDEQLKLSMEE
ncbi:hypothetical protein IWX90DRAFT_490725 [Phyllosticta citrichinensis]|uniref:Uncharacterized protein n=1 Tax=Phyllosticta citrichinensis TaxID=1130410 RepID=A0ABR1XFK0_9PEZI